MRRSTAPVTANNLPATMIEILPSAQTSVQKGNALEDAVYHQLTQDVAAGKIGIDQSCCRVFQKKGYYSKDRESDIIFDVSLEFWMPGASEWSILLVYECKNYSHKVPVSDLEEFFQKVEQVGAAGTKAVIVSSNSFQEGALSFARSKRMGVARYFPDRDLEWILRRAPSELRTQKSFFHSTADSEALTSDAYVSRYFDYHCALGEERTNSLFDLTYEMILDFPELAATLNIDPHLYQQESNETWIPFLSSELIETTARSCILKAARSQPEYLLEDLCLSLQDERGLIVHSTTLPQGVLAELSFDPLKIQIDDAQSGTDARRRFTLAHELGHIYLDHGRFMKREKLRASDTAIDQPSGVTISAIARLEWQANYFAACLLLPRRALIAEVRKQTSKRQIRDRGFGLLYLDDQKCNIDSFLIICSAISHHFKVSKAAVRLRLTELGLLREASTVKNAGILSENILRNIHRTDP